MFKRLTSVVLVCVLLSSFLILPASAADDDSYYSLPVVSSVALLASSDGFSSTDSSHLTSIFQQLTLSGSSYIRGMISEIYEQFRVKADGNIYAYISRIDNNMISASNFLEGISSKVQCLTTSPSGYSAGSVVGLLHSILDSLPSDMSGLATESTLSAFSSAFSSFSGIWKYIYDQNTWVSGVKSDGSLSLTNWKTMQQNLFNQFIRDTEMNYPDRLTLRGAVKRLQEVLANDEDKAIRDNQKENQQTVKDDFLNGSSSGSSLGTSDFGNLKDVGGTFKDISSLNGQASLDSFSSGLSEADSAGQGWFSQSTKDALDSVSASTSSESTVSTFSCDGSYSVDVDPDPYNMGDFENNYAWLWGEK